MAKCNIDDIIKKSTNGMLKHSDVVDCYRPQCDYYTNLYLRKQCSFIVSEWCWCSTTDGYAVEDTFQYRMPSGYCGKSLEYI